ncbi:MAG: DegT/DnrJ/EryC1/StrS family aminotransferase [Bacteroidota bacterium]|nr:DegT/DnrJ/EryC1/StrS family aminotransferase [Bacteroidota bacterium]
MAGTGANPLVEFYDLRRITERHRADIDQAVSRVIDSGWFLLGKEVSGFEQHYAGFIGTSHCVGVGNGLDALRLIFRAYKEMQVLHDGDEVIVPANTYIASILAVTENNLTPVLVEPDRQTLQLDDSLIEQAITPRTKAILLVHLYGRNAYTARIGGICQQHHLKLIEDNAQAAGCCYTDFSDGRPAYRRTGSLGDAAGHSFYPTKNLGALGDGGAVTTNDPELAGLIRSLANYGSSKKYVFPYQGLNSRLDELHAAVLDAKLPFLDAENDRRCEVARYYCEHLHHPAIEIPGLTSQLDPTTQTTSQPVTAARQSGQSSDPATQPFVASLSDRANSYHLFPILTPHRDALQQYLLENGVQTQIHYPVPPHKQACFKAWNDRSFPITEEIHALELSLPMSPLLTEAELQQVVGLLNNWKD